MRVNARLDAGLEEKVEYLKAATHATLSDVIKASIEVYYEQVRRREVESARRLTEAGFVGCGSGDPDLSERYKAELAALFEAKR